jgi:hypothetical protein
VRSLRLAVRPFVSCPGPWWIRAFMGGLALIGVSLSDVRVIMMIMRVLMVKLLCQVVMGWVPVLECLLPDTRGCQRIHPFLSGIKRRCLLRILTPESLTRYWKPLDVAFGDLGLCRAGHTEELQWAGRW